MPLPTALRRLALIASLGWAALAAGGCASRNSPPPAGSRGTLTVTVPHLERLDVSGFNGHVADINRLLSARAETFAKKIEQGSVWYGEGFSMEPLLAPGSWIVIRPHPYADLQPGMVVLYTPANGRPVVHALVRRTSRGWLAAGVNNRTPDREFVTPANLAGVIAAVFTPATP